MRIHLITGGVRCGKSRRAEDLARAAGGDAVTYVATARMTDEEMCRRIDHHRTRRPGAWVTREAPDDAGAAIREAATDVVLLDCLTVFLANALDARVPRQEVATLKAMEDRAAALLSAAAGRSGHLFVVTNEVGWGVHPETDIGRWFRDGLGSANQRFALAAEDVVLMVAGIPLTIKPAA
jgi:adenosylcobinamide kinase/adenosylcobinamide-phosphate guanylyltransferase